MGPSSVTNLRIWNEGMAIVRDCYALTRYWPRTELFGLTAQIRLAAVSIPCNLAEGRGRGTKPEMTRFAQIALGSLYELDTLLQIAFDLNFPASAQIAGLRDRLLPLARQISSFIQKHKSVA